jgi:hypothetical protein
MSQLLKKSWLEENVNGSQTKAKVETLIMKMQVLPLERKKS